MTTTRASIVITSLLLTAACGDDRLPSVPECDDIGWPLGVRPLSNPPPPEFEVECADEWGNNLPTRPASATTALPGAGWTTQIDPAGGWIMSVDLAEPGWPEWVAEQPNLPEPLPSELGLLKLEPDGSVAWFHADHLVWMFSFVDGLVWALGRNVDETTGTTLLLFDPASGELLDSRAWDLGGTVNQITPASDGGAWLSSSEDREDDLRVDANLHRASSIHAVTLVATRSTEDPRVWPAGWVGQLPNGAVAWGHMDGLEIVEPDGSVRWTRPDSAHTTTSDADTILLTSRFPTEVGTGIGVRLELVSALDGSSVWVREHRRFVVSDPDRCGPEDCNLWDGGYTLPRPDGGYLLIGYHAYPDTICPFQPMLMAISADGDAEWAHRVDVCGRFSGAALRSDGRLDVVGLTLGRDPEFWAGAWTRVFDL